MILYLYRYDMYQMYQYQGIILTQWTRIKIWNERGIGTDNDFMCKSMNQREPRPRPGAGAGPRREYQLKYYLSLSELSGDISLATYCYSTNKSTSNFKKRGTLVTIGVASKRVRAGGGREPQLSTVTSFWLLLWRLRGSKRKEFTEKREWWWWMRLTGLL